MPLPESLISPEEAIVSQSFRYVAVVRADNKIEQTFVLDGKQTIDELFQHVNDHRIVKMTGLEIHRDESVQPTFLDRIGAFAVAS